MRKNNRLPGLKTEVSQSTISRAEVKQGTSVSAKKRPTRIFLKRNAEEHVPFGAISIMDEVPESSRLDSVDVDLIVKSNEKNLLK